jgi:uncharacterized protein YndB with AHSA1/START domain
MIDIEHEIAEIHRQVERRDGDEAPEVGVVVRRVYDADPADVWDAITDPDRLRRWFLPVSGDLREGGTFQLEGNAGGRILRCEPPRLLTVTFGSETSVVELRLQPSGDQTVVSLEHVVPLEMAGSGAGALFGGPGWDGALLGLGLHLRGEVTDDPVAAASSPEGIEFSRQSAHAWLATVETSGTATPEEIAPAAEASMAGFAPGTPAPS